MTSPPMQATSLINLDEISRLITRDEDAHSRIQRCARATTGCRSVDEALEGSLEKGVRGLCCVSGDKGTGKTGLALAFLASHLLEKPCSNAAIIDTSGSLDVLRLQNILISRLQRDVAPRGHQTNIVAPSSLLEDLATKALERVKIMRVFDFVGVQEALEELKQDIFKLPQDLDARTMPCATVSNPGTKGGRKIEIADSEDESTEEEEEGEMLFGGTSRPKSKPVRTTEGSRQLDRDASIEAGGGNNWMLIVDNISQVLSPFMKVNYVQAHAMLVSFMRDLTQLARSHNLTSIVLNSGITRNPPPTPVPDPGPDGPDTSSTLPNYFVSSAFEACTTYPTLGKTFPFLVDMHILVSRMPKAKRDAEAIHKGSGQVSTGERGAVHVLEVLSDGWEGRAGKLAAFQCSDQGALETAAYKAQM